MEYTTNDLSKILDVSTNTIRRFGEKGHLRVSRDEENGYRKFNHSDVEKLMYVGKYRKVGIGHKEIAEILQQDIGTTLRMMQERKDELDAQIAQYKALSHLLKDDIALIKRIEEYGSDIIEMENSPMHYVLYQKRGELCTGGIMVRPCITLCPHVRSWSIFIFLKRRILRRVTVSGAEAWRPIS